MQVTFSIESGDGRSVDVDVAVLAKDPPRVDTLERLLPAVGLGEREQPLFSDGQLIPRSARLGDTGLRDGARLTRHRGVTAPSTSSGLLLKVVSGPDCGKVLPLDRGQHTIGRTPSAAVTVDDPAISQEHLRLTVEPRSVRAEDLGTTNGTLVDGSSLQYSQRLQVAPEGRISIGSSQLELCGTMEPPAVVRAGSDGKLMVHRTAGTTPAWQAEEIPIPELEHATPRPRPQWLAAVGPALAAGLLAVLLHSLQLLALAILGPIALLASSGLERRTWHRARRAVIADHRAAVTATRARVKEALLAEANRRRHIFADAACVLLAATNHDCRLWERHLGQDQFLVVRTGLADQPSQASIRAGSAVRPAGTQALSPATTALREHVLGVVGPARLTDGICRWLLGQLLVLHSPVDLSVVLLTDDSRAASLQWLRWLPDTVSAAVTPAQRRAVAEQLVGIVRERQREYSNQPWTGPWLLVMVDPAIVIAELPELLEVLKHGLAVGITMICVAEDRRVLPRGCTAALCVADDAGTEAMLSSVGAPELSVRIDRVGPDWAERIARRLAPLRDASDTRLAAGTGSASVAELSGLAELRSSAVRARWGSSAGRAVAPIGRSAGDVLLLDLDRDGPHLLVAGTTGSGKSELLRTLVSGLALSCSPEELAIVLVDYKGGSAFAQCADLPQVSGLVTDLNPQLTRRALIALGAELRRREHILARAGVSDLAGYRAGRSSADPQLPRLLLLIDEYASLAQDLPEFLTGLLSIAQRGRSLGVHLILATQRPAGVLSADIKANVGLRIALRVTDPAESLDIVGTAAASRISRAEPGRAIARYSDGALVDFQAACVSLPASDPDEIRVVELDGWHRPIHDAGFLENSPTELTQILQAVTAAAEGLRRPQRPWLDPLPNRIRAPTVVGSTVIEFGRQDRPAEQAQSALTLDLAAGSTLAFIGGPGSGRTTALRSLLGAATSQLTVDQLHLYVLDCAEGGIARFGALPHCGSAVGTADPALVGRLVARLATERRARLRELTALGVTNYAEGMKNGSTLPAVLVAIDGWENLCALSEAMDGGRTIDLLTQLLRDGPSAGITILLTGDRGVLTSRLVSVLQRRLILPLANRADYGLAGISENAVPVDPQPGRAVNAADSTEVQLGILGDDPGTDAQWQALQQAVLQVPARHHPPTIRLRPLPSVVTATDLQRRAGSRTTRSCLLGVGCDDGTTVEHDLLHPLARFLIAGPVGSGKSAAARLIAGQAVRQGLRTVVACDSRSPFAAWTEGRVLTPSEPVDELDADLVVIDDVDRFVDSPAEADLSHWLRTSSAAVLVTARTEELLASYRGIGADVRRHGSGILLQPSAMDGAVFDVRLPRLPAQPLPGRGVLVTVDTRDCVDGYLPIQVAWDD